MTYPLAQKNSNGALDDQTGEEKHYCKDLLAESDIHNSGLPANFGEVVKGIYRSSFPQPCNFPTLQTLGLRTIITLVEEPYTMSHANFLRENGIVHHRIVIQANKDSTIKTPDHIIGRVLEILLDKSAHPILIHCNKGKHRTGCVTGCFRKLQGWEMRDIISEYIKYSFPKSRPLDESFIDSFDHTKLSNLTQSSGAKSWGSSGSTKARNDFDQQSPKHPIQVRRNGIRVS